MPKLTLSISGDTLEEIREAAASLSYRGGDGELSVTDLTARLKAALPSMDIVMTPKAKGAEAEAPKRGRKAKEAEPEAEPEADPFGNKPAEAKPTEQSPAEARAAAVDILMTAYNDKVKQPKVLMLLKEFGVKKFAEVADDKAGELLAKAKAL